MIVRLSGTLVEVTEDSVVLERDGVARQVLVPAFALGELGACRGRSITLHTLEFYEGNPGGGNLTPRILGFLHPEDRLFFSRFLNVKGFGPRKALKALSEPVRRIAGWIEAGDGKSLARLPGIGPRGAELVVATLKGKMKDLALGCDGAAAEASVLTQAQRDALEVLTAWGDPRSDAERWLHRAAQLDPEPRSADEWVRVAYRVKSGVEG